MPKFGNLTYNDYVPLYVGQPVEEIATAANKADQDYQSNLATKDKLEIAIDNADVLSQDKSYLKAALDRSRQRLKQISDSGRWEDAGLLVNQSVKEYMTDKDVQTALAQKQARQKWIEDNAKRIGQSEDNNGITQEYFNRELGLADINYRGFKKDEKGNYINTYNVQTPSRYLDIAKRLDNRISGWKEGTVQTINGKQIERRPDGYFEVGSGVGVNYDEVYNALRKELESNPEIKQQINRDLYFDNLNNFTTRDANGNLVSRQVNIGDLAKLGIPLDNEGNILEKDRGGRLIKSDVNEAIKNSDGTINQDRLNSLYTKVQKDKTLDNYIDPAAQKAAFYKEDKQYLKNWKEEAGLDFYYKKKLKELDKEQPKYDSIPTSLWSINPLGEDVTNAGGGFLQSIGLDSANPKYDAFVKKYEGAKTNLDNLLSLRKPNTVDQGLEEKIQDAEMTFNNLKMVDEALQQKANEEIIKDKPKENKLGLKLYDDSPKKLNESITQYNTRLEVASKFKDQEKQSLEIDKQKAFDKYIPSIASDMVQYQQSPSIPNDHLNYEIVTNFRAKGFKEAKGFSGKTVTPDLIQPTGYITDLSGQGFMNNSFGYFKSKEEAEKAGGKIEEMDGKQANEMLKSAARDASSDENTVANEVFNEDDKVYRVPIYSKPATSTRDYLENTYRSKQTNENIKNFDANLNRNGVIQQFDGGITLESVARETGSGYSVKIPGQKEYVFPDRAIAVDFITNVNNARKLTK